jgi:hypothetical protein
VLEDAPEKARLYCASVGVNFIWQVPFPGKSKWCPFNSFRDFNKNRPKNKFFNRLLLIKMRHIFDGAHEPVKI